MHAVLGAFAIGVVAAHWVAPPFGVTCAAWCFAAVCLVARPLRPLAGLAVGFAWGGQFVATAVDGLADDCAGPVRVSATVIGLPSRVAGIDGTPERLRFEARLGALPACGIRAGARARLFWAEGPDLRPGEVWRLTVGLRRPRGSVNPAGFDYERWATRRELAAVGIVSDGDLAEPGSAPVDRLRLEARDAVARLGLANGGVVLALTTGDPERLTDADWQRYRDSGTIHLLVISGLHVGMFGAFGLALGAAGARVFGPRRTRARVGGAVTAVILIGAYALLSGAALPVLRAAIMATVGFGALGVGRRVMPRTAFLIALAVVLTIDPGAPLDGGFWLSFLAVATLVGFFAPRPRSRAPAALVWAQLVVWIGLAPLLSFATGQVPLQAPLVNLLMVPLVTMVVVPLAVLGVALLFLSPALAALPLGTVDLCIQLAHAGLDWVRELAPAHTPMATAHCLVAAALVLVFLLPCGRGVRAAAGAAALAAAVWPTDRLPFGRFEVTVLDVGQGASALVRTRGHLLVHDAGPSYPSGVDAGSAVVVPNVRRLGLPVSTLVLSHADLDHVGGAPALLRDLGARRVLGGEPVPGVELEPCRRGQRWSWDGVVFEVLHGGFEFGLNGNDASCVVLIEGDGRRVLLAGDVSTLVERRLLVANLDLLVVAHHGSKTSSHPAFVRRAAPRLAVVSAGFRNRFGHPHPDVVERYRNAGSRIVTTGMSGAVTWSSGVGAGRLMRCESRPHWRDLRNGC